MVDSEPLKSVMLTDHQVGALEWVSYHKIKCYESALMRTAAVTGDIY